MRKFLLLTTLLTLGLNHQKPVEELYVDFVIHCQKKGLLNDQDLGKTMNAAAQGMLINPITKKTTPQYELGAETFALQLKAKPDPEKVLPKLQAYLEEHKIRWQRREQAKKETVNPLKMLMIKPPPIAVGYDHVCVINDKNQVQCWGSGSASKVPQGLGPALQVTAGVEHSCAIKANNMVQCWGRNNKGQTDVPKDLGSALQEIGRAHV